MTDHCSNEILNCYLDGTLSTTEAQAVESHLLSCKECSEKYDSYFQVVKDIKNLQQLKAQASTADRVMAAINNNALPKKTPASSHQDKTKIIHFFTRFHMLVAACVIVALTAYTFKLFSRLNTEPPKQAGEFATNEINIQPNEDRDVIVADSSSDTHTAVIMEPTDSIETQSFGGGAGAPDASNVVVMMLELSPDDLLLTKQRLIAALSTITDTATTRRARASNEQVGQQEKVVANKVTNRTLEAETAKTANVKTNADNKSETTARAIDPEKIFMAELIAWATPQQSAPGSYAAKPQAAIAEGFVDTPNMTRLKKSQANQGTDKGKHDAKQPPSSEPIRQTDRKAKKKSRKESEKNIPVPAEEVEEVEEQKGQAKAGRRGSDKEAAVLEDNSDLEVDRDTEDDSAIAEEKDDDKALNKSAPRKRMDKTASDSKDKLGSDQFLSELQLLKARFDFSTHKISYEIVGDVIRVFIDKQTFEIVLSSKTKK